MAEFKTVYVVQGRMSSGPDDKSDFTDANGYPTYPTQYAAMEAVDAMRKEMSVVDSPRMAIMAAITKLIEVKLETRIVKRTFSDEVVDDVHAQALGEK